VIVCTVEHVFGIGNAARGVTGNTTRTGDLTQAAIGAIGQFEQHVGVAWSTERAPASEVLPAQHTRVQRRRNADFAVLMPEPT
jgi:hypothetical protein